VFNPRPAGSDRTTPHDINGYPVYKSSKMPAIGAGLKSIVFGNFGFVGMREAPELTVLRDPYSRAGYGEIIFHYYLRTVYKVLLAEAIQYATHPTA
jgi:HK97 family phage major capsid protein